MNIDEQGMHERAIKTLRNSGDAQDRVLAQAAVDGQVRLTMIQGARENPDAVLIVRDDR